MSVKFDRIVIESFTILLILTQSMLKKEQRQNNMSVVHVHVARHTNRPQIKNHNVFCNSSLAFPEKCFLRPPTTQSPIVTPAPSTPYHHIITITTNNIVLNHYHAVTLTPRRL